MMDMPGEKITINRPFRPEKSWNWWCAGKLTVAPIEEQRYVITLELCAQGHKDLQQILNRVMALYIELDTPFDERKKKLEAK
jgi:hypothetical protein